MMRRLAWPVLLLALSGAAAAAPADNAATCRTASGDAAIAACSSAIASGILKGRDLATAYNRRGFELDRKGDPDKAIADYSEAVRIDPKHAVAYYNRGLAYRQKHDLDHALYDYAEAIKVNPNYALAYSARGFVFFEKGDYDAAISEFDQAIKLDPRLAPAFAQRGLIYRNKGDYERSIADYDEAIRLDGRNVNWRINRGIAWLTKGDVDRAVADFDEAIRRDPKAATAHRERANAYARKGQFDIAIASYSDAVAVSPNFFGAFLDRARAYLQKADYAHAIADASRVLELNPQNGRAHNVRGFALKETGDLERALADFDEAIRLAPNLPIAYVNRGDIYRSKKQFDRALADLDEAIRLDPSLAAAYATRGLTYEASGDITQAQRDFATAVENPRTPTPATRGIIDQARARLAALGSTVTPSNETPAKVSTALPQPATPKLAVAPSVTIPQERRVALVIGNSGYRNVPLLPNALRDASAVATALRSVGFVTVTLSADLDRVKLAEALRDFARVAERSDWALIYYAGHGIEMGGVNYLIPVDAKLETDRDVQFEAVPLDQVLSSVEGAHKLRLVLLDACRENPFARGMRRTIATRSVGRGLAAIEPEGGTLVAYAAKHGKVAMDGEGANSPFAKALIKHIATPGVEINKLFRLVRDDVLAETGNQQEPFVYGSLPGIDFYFMPPLAKNSP